MSLLLKPVDTFFFRDHHDLEMGMSTKASPLFPPRPSTIYGALRSAYIYHYSDFRRFQLGEDAKVRRWMGTPLENGDFAIKGIFLYGVDPNNKGEEGKETEFFFTVPYDYLILNRGEGVEGYALNLVEERRNAWEVRYLLLSNHNEKTSANEGYYLSLKELKKALLYDEPVKVFPLSSWIEREEKIGIAHDWRTKRHIKGMLYNITTMRFKSNQTGLIVVTDQAPDYGEVRYARIGGRNRPWIIEQVDQSLEIFTQKEKEELIARISENGIAKLVLLTPAIWEQGNKPAGLNEEKILRLPEGLEAEYLTSAIGRPILIGGWDLVRNRPKPRVHAVPAGSTLYVRVRREDAAKFVEATYLMKMSDRLQHEGYGLVVPGAVNVRL